jgi:hypothetical protein
MELTIKTTSKEQDIYVNAFIKSLKELGVSVEKNKKNKTNNGVKAVEILKKLSTKKAFHSISDPIEWQKNMRKDRKLQ